MASEVVHLMKDGRAWCRRREPEQPRNLVLSEWPENVTCNAACREQAKAMLILADRARVAWGKPRGMPAGPHMAMTVRSREATPQNPSPLYATLDYHPWLMTLLDLEALAQLARRVEERISLMEERQEHRARYAVPGAPPDPEACQHHAVKQSGEHFHCWTCDGQWPATPEGIAEATAAATREGIYR